jgi:putative nucleotidyltransferase with HDIG domain
MAIGSIDMQSIQRQFQDIRNLLMAIVGSLSGVGTPLVSTAIQDITRVTQSLNDLEQSVKDRLKIEQSQLEGLMRTGRAINSSLGRRRVLEEVMDRLIGLMHAERGFLMSRQSDGDLKFEIARGLSQVNLEEDEFKVSMTVVRRVAETGGVILTTNAQEDPRFANQMSVMGYKLRSILCVPLKIKEKLIGVIYVDNKARIGTFRQDDLGLISAFADQAAVAIDNAQLIESLEASNEELQEAYQMTLAGWVHALDLRDKETEGHTQRVTILTERLARMMGMIGDDLIHLTRGALLHDIGKMAIPDGILLKPGELTEEERALIRKHPVYAYEMLYPIEFLRPALDIPYCHHERWDGTGYPRGLKGEEIPFAARIFPVVDVYDALVSNRPYRKGLPLGEVRDIIKNGSGTHFDPRVVEAFLAMGDYSV